MKDNNEKDRILVEDFDMAILLNNVLKENGQRNDNIPVSSFRSFSKEELESIKQLTLENKKFRDISALKYCTNLKDLRIKSVNAKDFFTKVGGITFVDDSKYEYESKCLDIQDYSVIENLESLEFLEIGYDSNLKKLDVSNLKNLYLLNLYQNENLTEVKGIEDSEIGELTLYRNNLSHSIDMEKIIDNRPCDFKLDFDMYPEIKKKFPDIIEKTNKTYTEVNWVENLSNLRTNELTTNRIDVMNEKSKEILEEVIGDGYTDIEKISAIYAYIIQNVEYDYEMLDTARGIENEEYKKLINNLSETMETYLDRKQSSYNAILKNKSVCEGYTNMMHYLLSSVGVQSKTVSCSNDVNKELVGRDSNHSVIRAKLEDDWYYFDPTWDAGKNILTNFMKTKEDFEKNHRLGISEKDIKVPEKQLYTKEELNKTLSFVLNDREERKKAKEKIEKQEKQKENNTEKKVEKRKVENYKSEVSSRYGERSSNLTKGIEKLNMNMPHEESMYYGISDIDDTIFRDGFKVKGASDEFLIDELSNRYSRGASPEKAKLIREFTELEYNAKFEDFDNPYSEIIEADSKQLLELEKVEGMTLSDVYYLDDYNSNIELEELPKDISLKNETYIATYEMEIWDPDLKKNIWKPVKEYYVKNEEGKLEQIGTGTYEKTTLNIDGHEIEIENENIEKKDTIDKVKQQYMAGNLLKSNIEDSMEEINAKGKITNVLQITDYSFLDDLAKQCGVEDTYYLEGGTFIVSTINEKGEEDFDIIVRNNNLAKIPYEHLKGIYKEEVTKEKANVQSRYGLKDGDIIVEAPGNTLKEFVTENGNRYVLTNIGGNIQFSEIYMENEKQMKADLIDTYSYKHELYDAYEDMDINKEDIDRAYDVLNRTREERELYNSDKEYEQEQEEQEL